MVEREADAGEPPGAARVIGRRRGAAAGATLIAVGGVHGNEPAGVRAARSVLDRLERDRVAIAGELVALAGNRRALAQGRRFLERDLNRQWTAAGMARAAAAGAGDAEAAELRELRAALDQAIGAARGPLFFLDLHTTSAEGIPFALIGDTVAQRAFASAFPLPLILGLEERLDGVLAEYMASRGAVALSIEGGQHESAEAETSLESALLVAVAAAGLCPRAALPGLAAAEAHLERLRGSLPRVIEILERHHLDGDEGFRMQPGYPNIGPVRAGALLARDRRGEIRAPRGGILLLPLYQSQGEEGFFLGRAIPAWEQRAATLARRLGADRLLAALPGVRRRPPAADAGATESLAVGPRAGRVYPRALFRWFGFRRVDPAADGGIRLARRRIPTAG